MKKYFLLLSILMIVMLVSCQVYKNVAGSENQDEISGNKTTDDVDIVIDQTQNAEVPEIKTSLPNINSTETVAYTQATEPVWVNENTLTPTFTVPTVSSLFAEMSEVYDGNKTEYLLETNGGCEFPCLWGFLLPGETKWEIAESTLDSFINDYINKIDSENYLYKSYILLDSEGYYLGNLNITGSDGIVNFYSVMYINKYFSISRILQEYGKPQEIYFYSAKLFDSNGSLLSGLLLDFSDKGFFVWYYDPDVSHKGMESGKAWWEYVPDSVASVYYTDSGIDWFLERARYEEGRVYNPLYEYTGMDVDAFYNHFISGNETLMIEFYPEEVKEKLEGD